MTILKFFVLQKQQKGGILMLCFCHVFCNFHKIIQRFLAPFYRDCLCPESLTLDEFQTEAACLGFFLQNTTKIYQEFSSARVV
jgi:hypothetical protein